MNAFSILQRDPDFNALPWIVIGFSSILATILIVGVSFILMCTRRKPQTDELSIARGNTVRNSYRPHDPNDASRHENDDPDIKSRSRVPLSIASSFDEDDYDEGFGVNDIPEYCNTGGETHGQDDETDLYCNTAPKVDYCNTAPSAPIYCNEGIKSDEIYCVTDPRVVSDRPTYSNAVDGYWTSH